VLLVTGEWEKREEKIGVQKGDTPTINWKPSGNHWKEDGLTDEKFEELGLNK